MQKAKDEGKSRTEWFIGKIEQTIDTFKIEDSKELVSEIKKVSNREIRNEETLLIDTSKMSSESTINNQY